MLTSIWGPSTWNSLHCISFVYPDNPTNIEKQQFKSYFESLKYILPCCVCRTHYTEHTKAGAKYEITDEVVDNKTNLTRWLYELHNAVDSSLGMKYDITYEDVCAKYGSYIAECDMSLEKKTIAFKNSYNQEAPLVIYKVAACFINYAKLRGLDDYEKNLTITKEMFDNKRSINNSIIISDNWIKRNTDCWEIVKYMKTNGIIGFEKTEQYHNLPTIEELKLLQLMSTTLCIRTLKHMIEKLGYKDISDCVD